MLLHCRNTPLCAPTCCAPCRATGCFSISSRSRTSPSLQDFRLEQKEKCERIELRVQPGARLTFSYDDRCGQHIAVDDGFRAAFCLVRRAP
jgi:hypothetical protein